MRVAERHGELTRRELQGLLDVSAPKITRIVAYLDDLGLLSASVIGEGGLGRPAASIRLSDEGLCVIAISLTAPGTTVALVALTGKVLESFTIDVDAEVPYETAIERLVEASQTLLGRARDRFTAIAGVGISFGGAASFAEGRLTMPSGFPAWHGRALVMDVQNGVGLPTFVDNQPVGYIRAMHWYNDQASADHYLCFADYGIAGCSSVGVLRPDRGVSTGGFGHVGGRPTGSDQCWCGLYDCLNTRASLRGLHQWGIRHGLLTEDAHITEAVPALEADPRGRAALTSAARELVTSTIDACRVLGIHGYVLGGGMFDVSTVVRSAAQEAVDAHKRIASGSFLPANLADRGPLLSAAAIVADGMASTGLIETFPSRAL